MGKSRTKISRPGELARLKQELNAEHGKAMLAMRDALQHARAAGSILRKVHELLRHGEWYPWLRRNFKGSHDTALRYMRIAKDWDLLHARVVADPKMSMGEALRILARKKEKEPKKGGKKAGGLQFHLLTPNEARQKLILAFTAMVNGWDDETVQCLAEFGIVGGRDFVDPIEEHFDGIEDELTVVARPLIAAAEKAECRLGARRDLKDQHLGELLAVVTPMHDNRDELAPSARAIVEQAFDTFSQLRDRESRPPSIVF